MSAATIRGMGRLCAVALALVAPGAQALEKVEFLVAGEDAALTRALEAASIILGAERDGQTEAQDILSDGRAEYGALLNALYARGHYSAVIHVYADGREVAAIAPLDAPARIDRIRVTVDPGPRFALSRTTVRPLPAGATLPEGFAPGAPAESGVVIAAAGAGVAGWRDQGHAKAKIAAQDIVADHARATLSADIQIAPGPVLRFGKLAITGQDRMRENRIRKIAGLPEGERFDPAELDRAASRLRRTGVFKSVSLAEDEAITPPEGGAPVVALLIAAETEDAAAATAAMQALADAPGTPPVYRDLAQLRLALRTDSGLDAQARIDLLRGLTGETQPFRNIAREALALALIETGETAEAATILTDLVADAATTPGQRQRAAQLMVALGGPTNEG